MDILDSNLSFGQLIPTEPLLKSAIGIHKFDDAKILNNSIGINYSGHIGFHPRAKKIADEIVKKNPNIKNFVEKLKTIPSPAKQIIEIRKFTTKNGDNIDVII